MTPADSGAHAQQLAKAGDYIMYRGGAWCVMTPQEFRTSPWSKPGDEVHWRFWIRQENKNG